MNLNTYESEIDLFHPRAEYLRNEKKVNILYVFVYLIHDNAW